MFEGLIIGNTPLRDAIIEHAWVLPSAATGYLVQVPKHSRIYISIEMIIRAKGNSPLASIHIFNVSLNPTCNCIYS